MKKLMILGASILQLPAIRQAQSMGIKVIAVDMDPHAVGFQEPGVITEVISTIDIPAVLEAAKRHQIDGIMTLASDMPMRTVATVAQALNLVGINVDTALKATNKAVMRQCLYKNNVPIPKFYRISNYDEYQEAIININQKFIVKPADNSGSRGIYLVHNSKDNNITKYAYNYSKKHSRSGELVVEEYMMGQEVSVETLSMNGVCHVIQITDKLTTGAPYFVEMGHSQPTRHPLDIIKKIRDVTTAAVKAIGIENGPSHTEIMVTSEGPKVVELGARLGGDCITTHLVPLSTGVNMVECCIRIALGEQPNFNPMVQKASAIRYFSPEKGILSRIEGMEQALNIDGVCEIQFVKKAGDTISEVRNSADRTGFVIAQGDTAAEAIAACEKAINHVYIKIKDDRKE